MRNPEGLIHPARQRAEQSNLIQRFALAVGVTAGVMSGYYEATDRTEQVVLGFEIAASACVAGELERRTTRRALGIPPPTDEVVDSVIANPLVGWAGGLLSGFVATKYGMPTQEFISGQLVSGTIVYVAGMLQGQYEREQDIALQTDSKQFENSVE